MDTGEPNARGVHGLSPAPKEKTCGACGVVFACQAFALQAGAGAKSLSFKQRRLRVCARDMPIASVRDALPL